MSSPSCFMKPLKNLNIIEFRFENLRALRRAGELVNVSSHLILIEVFIAEVANIQSFS